MTESVATKIDPSLLSVSPGSGETETCMDVNNLNLFYGEAQALTDISFQMKKNRVTAFIGPSGCGKSTLLRCFNRMNDLVDSVRVEGEIILDGKNIYASDIDVTSLRQRVGMVFQKPNPFPMSIFENVAYGLRLQGINKRRLLEEKVELKNKALVITHKHTDHLRGAHKLLSQDTVPIESLIINHKYKHPCQIICNQFHNNNCAKSFPN